MAGANTGSNAADQPAAPFKAAMRHFQAGRLAQAEEKCREALNVEPQHADFLHLLGLIHAQRNDIDLAIELIAQAIRNNQADPEYFSNLGALLAHRHRFEEAFKSFDLALKLKPDFVEVWIALGDLLQQQQQMQEALLAYNHVLSLDQRNAEAAGKGARLLQALQRPEDAVTAYIRWAELDPNNYDAHNDLGTLLMGLARYEEAAAAFKAATRVRPKDPAAFNNLGIALTNLKRYAEALVALDRAIALAPSLAEPHNARAHPLRMLDRLDEALDEYDRAIALKPDYAEAHGYRGTCLDELARPEEALASFQKALSLQPDHGDTRWNLAVNRLRAGDFATGWREAEWRWKSSSLRMNHRVFDQPLWLGDQSIEGKTLLLHNDQGLGDAIQFCRYIPLLAARGARVILEVGRALQELLAGLDGVAQLVVKGEALPAFDFHCPLTSLPLPFGTTLDNIPSATPYLRVPEGARDWRDWLGPTTLPRIGVVWSGNPNHVNDHNRSLPLQLLGPLFDSAAQFISLQKDARASDQEALRKRSDVRDAGVEFRSFADTAALVAQLDLVISVDTSVAHLAGSLGKPVWILLPHVADWRWLTDRADSPWYPTARLFRQGASRRWEPVVAELREGLQDFLSAARSAR
jgi:tetratricopeptide (TPR) repeat protein